MKLLSIIRSVCFFLIIFLLTLSATFGQSLSDFKNKVSSKPGETSIENKLQFNGYTNYWHDNYTQWYRYGDLFKMAVSELQSNILQSKIDIAEDLGIPGLVMQEGFISKLLSNSCQTLKYPTSNELETVIKQGSTFIITDSQSALGKTLEEKADGIFDWTEMLKSHQFGAVGFEKVKAFYLINGDQYLFVVSSTSQKQVNLLLQQIENTKELIEKYDLHKGWFGASTLLKSVTCAQGHPLEVIGKGMNEGNSWFVFDGYMDFLAKDEIKKWMDEVNLPVIANVGFSPIYGCENYEGLQVQDMATSQAWIDYAHEKGGFAFRQVYNPKSDEFDFDGYIANEGNKKQIDNENVPFINKTGMLDGNMTSSMVLFIEKNKALSDELIWDAIMNRREVAVLEKAKMMGPAKFRSALQLLYLDKDYLEGYFGDKLDVEAKVEGYDLVLTVKNYYLNSISGNFEITTTSALKISDDFNLNFTLQGNEAKQLRIPLTLTKEAMGKTNPIAIHFLWDGKKKSTLTMLDLPPAISVHQLLYAHAPKVSFPATIHNFSKENLFPVEIEVYKKDNPYQIVFQQTKTCETATFKEMFFDLKLEPGEYTVNAKALGTTYKSQLGVGKAEGTPFVYEMDLNSDGINEYRMENDSVQITLLRTGARVIEYIVKSKKDNVLFKIWPEKAENHKRPFRERGFYPFGGFEDFLGQASMETHKIYDAKIIQKEGDFVRVEMEADYFGNRIKKIFTLYGNSPLLEVRFALVMNNPEANVLGPQPILHLGKNHGTEDVFIVPTMEGLKEYRMRPEQYYGQKIDVKEGWNAGYDTDEDITFVGAFPVAQPLFLHMWMNHPSNSDAPHYYVEFQPWTPIIQKSTMYFSYYLWGSGGAWQNGVDELRKRNLITTR